MLHATDTDRNRDKLRPDGPLGSNVDLTYAPLSYLELNGEKRGKRKRKALMKLLKSSQESKPSRLKLVDMNTLLEAIDMITTVVDCRSINLWSRYTSQN